MLKSCFLVGVWVPQDVELASQLQVPDLGERMHAALTAVLQQGASKVGA
jgi:hypothetical protein